MKRDWFTEPAWQLPFARRYSQDYVRALARLKKVEGALMHFLDASWSIHFRPATPDMAESDEVLIQADWDGKPLACALPQSTLICALALRLRRESCPPLSEWPEVLLSAGRMSTLKMLRRYLRSSYQGRLSRIRAVAAAENDERTSGLRVFLRSPDRSQELMFCIWAGVTTVPDLVEMFAASPVSQAEAHGAGYQQQIDAIPLSGSLIMATLRLTLAELTSLEIGDVLLPQPLTGDTRQGRFLHFSKALGLSVLIHDATEEQEVSEMNATVKNANLFAHHALTPTADIAAVPEQCLPIDALEILLSFEIGRSDLTVGQLRELSPGAMLHVSAAAPGNVNIHANGRLIGRGLIIEIDGCTGVQITEFAARD